LQAAVAVDLVMAVAAVAADFDALWVQLAVEVLSNLNSP
jgi:hypothetical protein